jgi:hypothetical protein
LEEINALFPENGFTLQVVIKGIVVQNILMIPNRFPSSDTYWRVFARIDPE